MEATPLTFSALEIVTEPVAKVLVMLVLRVPPAVIDPVALT